MDMQELFNHLKARFPDSVLECAPVTGGEPFITVSPEGLLEVCEHLRGESAFEFDYLMCLSGVDYPPDRLGVTYHLYSNSKRMRCVLKAFTPRAEPKLPSVARIWKTANWHEREAYDMYGIHFTAHPNLRRILLPHDWEGFPLRKDYVFPTEYRGIKCHD